MKLLFYLSVTLLLSFKLSAQNSVVVEQYFKSRNSSDFSKLEPVLSADIKYKEGDIVLSKSVEEFYANFQWDSVFNPVWDIVSIKALNNKTEEVTWSKVCPRIQYLQDTVIIVTAYFTIKNNQITEIKIKDYPLFDFQKWGANRDTLSGWIEINYPEMNGYVQDMTIKGAKNYLKAIDLYHNR